MHEAESALFTLGCPKVNLQVRFGNDVAIQFYESIGYYHQNHHSMAKLLPGDSVTEQDRGGEAITSYYTLNGEDPREIGGALSPGMRVPASRRCPGASPER